MQISIAQALILELSSLQIKGVIMQQNGTSTQMSLHLQISAPFLIVALEIPSHSQMHHPPFKDKLDFFQNHGISVTEHHIKEIQHNTIIPVQVSMNWS